MKNEKLFGDMTPKEIEEFEEKTNGKIIFNSLGENALSFQVTDQADIMLFIDKVDSTNGSYPNVFLLEPAQISNLYNLLADVVNSNPKTYTLISK